MNISHSIAEGDRVLSYIMDRCRANHYPGLKIAKLSDSYKTGNAFLVGSLTQDLQSFTENLFCVYFKSFIPCM